MKMNFTARQMKVYDQVKETAEKKLAKFEKFFPGSGDATVTLSCKHNKKFIRSTNSSLPSLVSDLCKAEQNVHLTQEMETKYFNMT